MPFQEYRKVCPACGSSYFTKRYHFHWFKQFYCRKCKCTFFLPKKVKNLTSATTENKNSTYEQTNISHTHHH
jgi:transcription initiation factor TFIIIB Brf1 subunit/transcription initiation factor TFIIB